MPPSNFDLSISVLPVHIIFIKAKTSGYFTSRKNDDSSLLIDRILQQQFRRQLNFVVTADNRESKHIFAAFVKLWHKISSLLFFDSCVIVMDK